MTAERGSTRRSVLAAMGAVCAAPALALTPSSAFAQNTPYGGAMLPVAGGRLHYDAGGSGARTLVLMHDAITDSSIWDDVWPIFAREFRVARYDRRGFGRSPAAEGAYSSAADLGALVAQLGAPSVAIIAGSASAQIALDYAIASPAMVQQILLVSPIVAGPPPANPLGARIAANNAPLASGDIAGAVNNWVSDRYIVAGPNRRARARLRAVLESSPHDLTHADPPATPPLLSRVQAPVQILSGARDVPEVIAHSQSLERMIPGALRAPVQGSGHLIYIDEPEIFAAAAIAFVRGWQSRDP